MTSNTTLRALAWALTAAVCVSSCADRWAVSGPGPTDPAPADSASAGPTRSDCVSIHQTIGERLTLSADRLAVGFAPTLEHYVAASPPAALGLPLWQLARLDGGERVTLGKYADVRWVDGSLVTAAGRALGADGAGLFSVAGWRDESDCRCITGTSQLLARTCGGSGGTRLDVAVADRGPPSWLDLGTIALWPAVADGGQQVAYLRPGGGPTNDCGELTLWRPGDGEHGTGLQGSMVDLHGGWLLYSQCTDDDQGPGDLMGIAPGSDRPVRLAPRARFWDAGVDGASDRILATNDEQQTWRVVSLDGPRQLTGPWPGSRPVFVAGGRYVVVYRDPAGGNAEGDRTTVLAYRSDGGDPQQVIAFGPGQGRRGDRVAFHPRNDRVAFVDDAGQLCLASLASGERLRCVKGTAGAPLWLSSKSGLPPLLVLDDGRALAHSSDGEVLLLDEHGVRSLARGELASHTRRCVVAYHDESGTHVIPLPPR